MRKLFAKRETHQKVPQDPPPGMSNAKPEHDEIFTTTKKVSAFGVGLLRFSPRLEIARQALDYPLSASERKRYCEVVIKSGSIEDLASLSTEGQLHGSASGSFIDPSLQVKLAARLQNAGKTSLGSVLSKCVHSAAIYSAGLYLSSSATSAHSYWLTTSMVHDPHPVGSTIGFGLFFPLYVLSHRGYFPYFTQHSEEVKTISHVACALIACGYFISRFLRDFADSYLASQIAEYLLPSRYFNNSEAREILASINKKTQDSE